MNYANLEQRMIDGYINMFPSFVPKKEAEVSVDNQKEFYDLMNKLYKLLFEDAALLLTTLHEDDAYPNRYKKSYGKPELDKNVLKLTNAVESLLKNMFFLGKGEEVKLNKRQVKILQLLEIDDVSKLPEAWIWMSNRPDANPVAFAYCLFDENYVYTTEIYSRLLGEKSFHRLEEWMLAQGYKAYDMYNKVWVNYQLTLTYANPA